MFAYHHIIYGDIIVHHPIINISIMAHLYSRPMFMVNVITYPSIHADITAQHPSVRAVHLPTSYHSPCRVTLILATHLDDGHVGVVVVCTDC